MNGNRAVFEVDVIRLDGKLRACLTVKADGKTFEAVERDYPAGWNMAEAAADLLAIYRDTPWSARSSTRSRGTRGE